MTTQDIINILTIQRARLQAAQTYEEYRDAHVAYLDMLIKRYEADIVTENAVKTFTHLEAIVREAKPYV